MQAIYLCAIILLGATLSAAYFFYRLHRQLRLHHHLGKNLVKVEQRVLNLSNRFSLLNEHATDYIMSIGPELTHDLYQAQNTIAMAKSALEELRQLLSLEDANSLSKAESILHHHFSIQSINKPSTNYSTEQFRSLNPGWMERINTDIQEIGRVVVDVSQKADKAGIPKRKKRMSTFTAMREVGVKGIDIKMPQMTSKILPRIKN
jgi:hypothetical protein